MRVLQGRPGLLRGGLLALAGLLCMGRLQAESEPVFQRLGVTQGLSQVSVQAIAEDSRGLLWVGTQDGLNRFDGYRFLTLRHQANDPASLSSDTINALLPGLDGRLWVLTPASLDVYDPRSNRVERLPHRADSEDGFSGRQVGRSLRDSRGRLWFATPRGVTRFDTETRRYRHFQPWKLHDVPVWHNQVAAIAEAPAGTLWVASAGGLQWFDLEREQFRFALPDWLHQLGSDLQFGFLHATPDGIVYAADHLHLHRFDVTRQQHQMWTLAEIGLVDMPNVMQVMANGDEWIGSTHGLFHRPLGAARFRMYRYHGQDADSLPGEFITRLHADRAGNLWVGTYTGGLAKLSANAAHVRYFRASTDGQGRATSAAVNVLARDSKGGVVIGNFDGLLTRVDPQTEQMTPLLSRPPWRPDVTPVPMLTGMVFDRQDRLWMSSTNGVYRLDPDGRQSAWFADRKRGGPPIARWLDVAVDAQDQIWVLATTSGIYRYRPLEDDFLHVPLVGIGDSDQAPTLARLHARPDGWLWIAAELPYLFAWHPQRQQQRSEKLSCATGMQSTVHHLGSDDAGRLLLGTPVGLFRFDPQTGSCEHLSDAQGLANRVINASLADADGQLWLATNRGISRYEPDSGRVVNFSAADGLHHGEFNAGAAVRVGDRLLFGGINGVAAFDPANMKHAGTSPAVLLLDLQVNFQPLRLDGRGEPASTATYLESLQLDHQQNNLSFSFAAADLSAPEDYLYAWRLRGARDQWVETGPESRQATYTGLAPGQYTFEVRARRAGHEWGPVTALPITVVPAWWQQNWARGLFALVVLLLLASLIASRVYRLRRRNDWLEKAVAERTRRINDLMAQRTRLFANMSHELRTPLTLVLSPLSELQQEPAAAPFRSRLESVYRHAKRLAGLIDDVLAIARLQDPNQPPPPGVRVPLRLLLLSLLESFQPVAARSGVLLRWQRIDDVSVECPPDDPGIIVGNLLSNALKYTDPGGAVDVALTHEPDAAGGPGWAVLSVRDTGIGIPADQQQQIFEPFFRGAQARPTPDALAFSTGLGLAHVRELATRIGGDVRVDSTVGVGSSFIVRLPCAPVMVAAPVVTAVAETAPAYGAARHSAAVDAGAEAGEDAAGATLAHADGGEADWEKPSLLIIEDNAELNAYLCQLFGDEFDCLSSGDGAEGERLAFEHLPDLVISDIRLPNMDGITLAEHLKTDMRTSHIPIILLTAVADHDVRIRGLSSHVDDFIGKPFHVDELRQRINNLLRRQAALRDYFRRDTAVSEVDADAGTGVDEAGSAAPAPVMTETDRRFLRQLDDVLGTLLENPELDLPMMAGKLYLSKKQVQRKVRALTGLTPMEYLRQLRLNRAADMLRAGEPVSRVVYAVGFSSQSYFTTCFKQAMGLTPKAWQQQQLQPAAARKPAARKAAADDPASDQVVAEDTADHD